MTGGENANTCVSSVQQERTESGKLSGEPEGREQARLKIARVNVGGGAGRG